MIELAEEGRVTVFMGGQWGSEAKGTMNAYLSDHAEFDIITTNNGVQSGHTWYEGEEKKVAYHLPTIGVRSTAKIFLNAGAIIEPNILLQEMRDLDVSMHRVVVSPWATVVEDRHRAAEAGIGTGTTAKGVGAALSDRVMRRATLAKDCDLLLANDLVHDYDLNTHLRLGWAVGMEIPQGYFLGPAHGFYPHCTSRNCTPAQALADAKINPKFMGKVCVALRTFPIRIAGNSGPVFSDQRETTWDEIGVEAEITTVTKKVRRVFTFSERGLKRMLSEIEPDLIFLSFCNYMPRKELQALDSLIRSCYTETVGGQPVMLYSYGKFSEDTYEQIR